MGLKSLVAPKVVRVAVPLVDYAMSQIISYCVTYLSLLDPNTSDLLLVVACPSLVPARTFPMGSESRIVAAGRAPASFASDPDASSL